jgi:hypothetical protein
LIGPAELCIHEIQTTPMAKKAIGQRRRRETDPGSPAPDQVILRKFELHFMIFDPVPLAAPFDAEPLSAQKDAK